MGEVETDTPVLRLPTPQILVEVEIDTPGRLYNNDPLIRSSVEVSRVTQGRFGLFQSFRRFRTRPEPCYGTFCSEVILGAKNRPRRPHWAGGPGGH